MVGELWLVASMTHLTGAFWSEPQHLLLLGVSEASEHPVLVQASQQLSEYLAGTRKSFDIPLLPQGTPFQERVWRHLQTIPYGYTVTYLKVAQSLGDPKSVRAVGAANGKNPISIFIPCHRVIGTSGKLTGYAGGIEQKKILLAHETKHSANFFQNPFV